MTRRHFIRALAVLLVATSTYGCGSYGPKIEKRPGFPIVQGLTNATATQLAIVTPRDANLAFSFSRITLEERGRTPKSLSSEIKDSASSDTVVHHVTITGLEPGSVYRFEIRGAGLKLLDSREFQSLDLKPRPARVAAASCLYDLYLKESRVMWKAVVDAKPDLLLLIGDNVYAEIANGRFASPLNEAALWTRYTETFSVLDFYRAPRLIPTVVTWDDHDYGMKDGNRDNPHKLESKKVLESFFAQTASPEFPEFQVGPGVSSILDAFGYRFMLLDDRSFRSPKGIKEETHFGEEQEIWIFKKLQESKAPAWLVSGDQWFGGYHRFESYEGTHPASFKKFMERLRKLSQTVMFLSGDRHLSEVNRIEPELLGYQTYEFTSSSLHSKAHPANWDTIPNGRQVRGVDMAHSFTLFELTPPMHDSKPGSAFKIRGAQIGAESHVHYIFDFDIPRAPSTKARP